MAQSLFSLIRRATLPGTLENIERMELVDHAQRMDDLLHGRGFGLDLEDTFDYPRLSFRNEERQWEEESSGVEDEHMEPCESCEFADNGVCGCLKEFGARYCD